MQNERQTNRPDSPVKIFLIFLDGAKGAKKSWDFNGTEVTHQSAKIAETEGEDILEE